MNEPIEYEVRLTAELAPDEGYERELWDVVLRTPEQTYLLKDNVPKDEAIGFVKSKADLILNR